MVIKSWSKSYYLYLAYCVTTSFYDYDVTGDCLALAEVGDGLESGIKKLRDERKEERPGKRNARKKRKL